MMCFQDVVGSTGMKVTYLRTGRSTEYQLQSVSRYFSIDHSLQCLMQVILLMSQDFMPLDKAIQEDTFL